MKKISNKKDLNDFLKSGGDINMPTKEGNILLSLLTNNKLDYLLIIDVIKKGVDVNKTNEYGQNALFFCDNEKILKALIEKKININQIDCHEQNALFYCKNKKIANLLIKENINIHKKNNDGLNALFFCNFEIIKKLIDLGCDYNLLDKNDNTFSHSINLFSINNYKNEKKYSEFIDYILNLFPNNPKNKYQESVVNYINWSKLEKDTIIELVILLNKHEVNINFEKEYKDFFNISKMIKSHEFKLGEVLCDNFKGELYKYLDENFIKLYNSIKDIKTNEHFKKINENIYLILTEKEKTILLKNIVNNNNNDKIKKRM